MGLVINISGAEYLVLSGIGEDLDVSQDKPIRNIPVYTYLEVKYNPAGNNEEGIRHRIGQDRTTKPYSM